jgi:hypothetical protein
MILDYHTKLLDLSISNKDYFTDFKSKYINYY